MENIKYITGNKCPEDQYVKEFAILDVSGVRYLYIRKESKTGGKFWTTPSVTITTDGEKKHLHAFLHDSTFLNNDIKSYLDERKWENDSTNKAPSVQSYNQEEVPF